MDSFFAELKAAREVKGISLDEIAGHTLINIQLLEALERGDIDVVPQAYMRAFIREYAGVVGIDPAETMQKYDKWLLKREAAHTHPPPDQSPSSSNETPENTPRHNNVERFVPVFFKAGVAIVVLVLADIVLWGVLEKEPPVRVKEVPFHETVKENERRAGIRDTVDQVAAAGPTADSAIVRRTGGTVPTIIVDRDSLTLVAATTDSVWLQIVIDQRKMSEHFLYPNTTFKWKAKDEFWITKIGNPTAITMALDNRPVEIPVRRGFVTSDVYFKRNTHSGR
ncbi:MAG: DUF4115 domain-containing protein [Bacteroidetes bacterium]|nr:DUF4115 domain-containing protein [Bacteroidota bacterium]MCW5895578.1 DUF4115 domain-containing protein [Bacteroidota bacterium]